MRKISEISFALAILFLPLDNFPLGTIYLREFGGRPTNVFLLVASTYFLAKFTKLSTIRLIHLRLAVCTFSVAALSVMNFFFANVPLKSNVIGRLPETQWALQTLMLGWMLMSLWIWVIGFRVFLNSRMIISAFVTSIYVSLYFFLDDISPFVFNGAFDFPINGAMQSFWGGDHDMFRPAGLCSEPSIYSSWALIAWPLVLVLGRLGRINMVHSFVLCSILIVTAIGSTSRTFLAVLLIQLPIIAIIVFRKATYGKAAVLILAFVCCAMFAPSIYMASIGKVTSIFDASQSLSTLARNSGKETAYLIFADHPLFGIGTGQFSSFYPDYVPSKFMASHEVERFVRGESDSRMSTYSFPARILVEHGLFGALLMTIIASYCVFVASRKALSVNVTSGLFIISFLGGVSFYFQQDQYGYQPGVMSIALFFSLRRQPE